MGTVGKARSGVGRFWNQRWRQRWGGVSSPTVAVAVGRGNEWDEVAVSRCWPISGWRFGVLGGGGCFWGRELGFAEGERGARMREGVLLMLV
ncbi:hypothetical protein PIB30_013315, partial [Stylosanthes scabra]|nr:hypothetical protein [Stylosanthes scabra]